MFQRELYLQKGLYELGVSVVEPLAALELGDTGIIIQEYVEGETVDKLAAQLPYNQKVQLMQGIVKELARYQAKATLHAPELRTLVGTTPLVDMNENRFAQLVEKDYLRLTENQSARNMPVHIAEVAAAASQGQRKYAGHLDFHPWNVMAPYAKLNKPDSRILLLDWETATLPSADGKQGAFVGYDLATLLSWPQFEIGPLAQRDLIDLFVHEFNQTLREEPLVKLGQYHELKLEADSEFKERLTAVQMQAAYWIAGIETNEVRKGNSNRRENAVRALKTVAGCESRLGYRPGTYAQAA